MSIHQMEGEALFFQVDSAVLHHERGKLTWPFFSLRQEPV